MSFFQRLPRGFECEVVEGQVHQPGALTESQVLRGSTVDVVDEIEWSQAALLKGH